MKVYDLKVGNLKVYVLNVKNPKLWKTGYKWSGKFITLKLRIGKLGIHCESENLHSESYESESLESDQTGDKWL